MPPMPIPSILSSLRASPVDRPPLRFLVEFGPLDGLDRSRHSTRALDVVIDGGSGLRVAPVDSLLPSLLIGHGGLAVAAPAGRGGASRGDFARAATWDQVAHFARTGEMSPKSYGVVVDGELAYVEGSQSAALDRATDARAVGRSASVVALSADLAAKFRAAG